MALAYKKLDDWLILNDIIQDFLIEEDNEMEWLIQSFVVSHNSSLVEKSWTTYVILDEKKVKLGFFVLNLWELRKNSKNKLFFSQNNLSHKYYPIINLEFLMRKPWEQYQWIWDFMLKSISEIIIHIEEKMMIKYIYINSIRKRMTYFEWKWFVSVSGRSRLSGTGNIDMLLKI